MAKWRVHKDDVELANGDDYCGAKVYSTDKLWATVHLPTQSDDFFSLQVLTDDVDLVGD